jgi:antitoxin VapB
MQQQEAGGGHTAMSLNIKNEETTRMVRELAALKGVSLVVAVSEAVKEKLEKEKAEREQAAEPRKSRYDLLMEFADLCSNRIKNPTHSWEIDALLYDENGLPK